MVSRRFLYFDVSNNYLKNFRLVAILNYIFDFCILLHTEIIRSKPKGFW